MRISGVHGKSKIAGACFMLTAGKRIGVSVLSVDVVVSCLVPKAVDVVVPVYHSGTQLA